jgi:hypothetical protein
MTIAWFAVSIGVDHFLGLDEVLGLGDDRPKPAGSLKIKRSTTARQTQ